MSMLSASMSAPTMGESGSIGVFDSFSDFIRSQRPGVLIVELQAQPRGRNFIEAGFAPTMGAPTMALENAAGPIIDEPLWLQLSSEGYRFRPDDPAAPRYRTDGTLARRVTTRSQITLNENLTGAPVFQVGQVEINDQEGEVSPLIESHSWAGREMRFIYGPKGGTRPEFRVIGRSFQKDWVDESDGRRSLRLQDFDFAIDHPVTTRQFGGTGGVEGALSVAGTLKPRLIGRRRHFTPRLIDPSRRYHMYHDGEAHGVLAAYYGAADAPIHAIVDNFIDFATIDLPEGMVVDCPALGICRDRPAGGIDAPFAIDARGDARSTAQLGDLIALLYREYAGLSIQQYNAAALGAFNIGEGGYWADGLSTVSIKTIANRLALDAGGKIGPGAVLTPFVIQNPATTAHAFELNSSEIVDIRRAGRVTKPVLSLVIEYAPNDLQLTADQILGAAEPDFASYAQKTGERIAPTPSASIALQEDDFISQVTLKTSLVEAFGANLLAQRYRPFFGSEQLAYDIEVSTREPLLWPIGSIVKVTHREAPWITGANALIVRNEADYDVQRPVLRVVRSGDV